MHVSGQGEALFEASGQAWPVSREGIRMPGAVVKRAAPSLAVFCPRMDSQSNGRSAPRRAEGSAHYNRSLWPLQARYGKGAGDTPAHPVAALARQQAAIPMTAGHTRSGPIELYKLQLVALRGEGALGAGFPSCRGGIEVIAFIKKELERFDCPQTFPLIHETAFREHGRDSAYPHENAIRVRRMRGQVSWMHSTRDGMDVQTSAISDNESFRMARNDIHELNRWMLPLGGRRT
jgi:hypothetical protein